MACGVCFPSATTCLPPGGAPRGRQAAMAKRARRVPMSMPRALVAANVGPFVNPWCRASPTSVTNKSASRRKSAPRPVTGTRRTLVHSLRWYRGGRDLREQITRDHDLRYGRKA